ncbi:SDR family oxidoreductase [Candidatus Halobonum tyrrellensis]|uniref:Oxidoreductase n=1 Tax=Candidatus Halobonum tyrrellensis G22 TaxID=1324957 RepID=V4IY62_9EURY|nr:SDR family oxidoreductase [Candidatus Halobonum tyrrellensis]ESP88097.1 oxidoreductase [Candidatus Halobonum tyrrellensis G22]
MRSLDGETAVVTGASSGIGEAIAHHLAEAGANVVLGARRLDQLDRIAADLAAEYGAAALPVETDVTDREQVDALVDAAVSEFGALDALVNNAGVGLGGEVESMDDDDYHTMTDVNVDGMFYATRAALPHVRETQGTLVFIGSFAGHHPRPGNPVYAATKWWTRGFAHSLEGQVGDDGVAVSVINPSEVRTEFGGEDGEAFEDRFEPGDVTDPAAVAEAVGFALAREAPDTVSELNLYRRDKFAEF